MWKTTEKQHEIEPEKEKFGIVEILEYQRVEA